MKHDDLLQEYPHHLIMLKDQKRLETFLCDWRAIDRLYEFELSQRLIKLWNKVSAYIHSTTHYHIYVHYQVIRDK